MKIVFAILLSLSLYAPSLVKLAAYTDCTIQLIANTDPFFCDCSKVKNFISIPSKEDAVKNASPVSTDWKYLGVHLFKFLHPRESNPLKLFAPSMLQLPDAPIIGILRPPIV